MCSLVPTLAQLHPQLRRLARPARGTKEESKGHTEKGKKSSAALTKCSHWEKATDSVKGETEGEGERGSVAAWLREKAAKRTS
jgi:hypothetical protein